MSSRASGPSCPRPCTSRTNAGSKPRHAFSSEMRAIEEKKRDCTSRRLSIGDPTDFVFDRPGTLGFVAQGVKLGDVLIPLDKGRDTAIAAQHQTIELPHRRDHGAVMRIEEVGAQIPVPGKMNLADTVCWQGHNVCFWFEAVIGCADVYVIHVKQDAAVGAFRNL